jgi:hypothetical protein
LDGWIFGFANPGNFEFHVRDLITAATEQRGLSSKCTLINLKTQRSRRNRGARGENSLMRRVHFGFR